MILVVRHTFGRHLNFNPHFHILVSDGGLRIGSEEWSSGLHFDKTALMKRWCFAFITYLREALRRGFLQSDLAPQAMRTILTRQYERWWNVDLQSCAFKDHFIRYAGRYVRRPLLAQYPIAEHSSEKVCFRTKDHKLKKEVITEHSAQTFIDLLADQIPSHYKHGIRHFGLLSPRSRGRTFGSVFAQLGQPRRPKPRHLSWEMAIERDFGHNRLLDSIGERMQLVARRQPASV